MSKQPKITIVPPAEQDVFFQEQQFDEALGKGTNPISYVNIPQPIRKIVRPPSYSRKAKKVQLAKAEKALEGHENKAEIMKILKRGL